MSRQMYRTILVLADRFHERVYSGDNSCARSGRRNVIF